MNRKDTEQAIHAELSRHPSIRYSLEHGGKHPYVALRCGAKARKVFYSFTPVERRAALNMVATIRRAVREVSQ